ncbi:hypothetical protein M0R45_008905 [Rubus argutus]|uniref:Uncharacterized protein n=1 Tax=Rubus argutus TaxID=59490 RepID=A0AAW1Y227_RUBAR
MKRPAKARVAKPRRCISSSPHRPSNVSLPSPRHLRRARISLSDDIVASRNQPLSPCSPYLSISQLCRTKKPNRRPDLHATDPSVVAAHLDHHGSS